MYLRKGQLTKSEISALQDNLVLLNQSDKQHWADIPQPIDKREPKFRDKFQKRVDSHIRSDKTHKHLPLGVTPYRRGKFRSQIAFDGVHYNLGNFDTVEEASAAYLAAKFPIY